MGNVVQGSGVSPNLSSLLDNNVISRDDGPTPANFKIIQSGELIEIYEYDNAVWVNVKKLPYEPVPLTPTQIMDHLLGVDQKPLDDDPIKKIATEKRRIHRARTNMRRLIQTNFDNAGKLLTLTFANTDRFDITSLAVCNTKKTYFYRQLRDQYPGCKFVAVPEFQKRGAVHYHVVINLPFVPVKSLRPLWPYGFIKINKIYNPAKVGGYIAKYLVKNVADPRFTHHRCYSSSLNLTKPKVMYALSLDSFLSSLDNLSVKPTFKTQFYSQYRGVIHYSSYNLYQTPAPKELNG